MFDSAKFYSTSPEKLLTAHKLLEAHIEEFAIHADMEADLLQKYREKRSVLLKQAREMSIPVSIASETVKGDCAKEKSDYMKANTKKKKALLLANAYTERIYSIRHLNKPIAGQIKTQ